MRAESVVFLDFRIGYAAGTGADACRSEMLRRSEIVGLILVLVLGCWGGSAGAGGADHEAASEARPFSRARFHEELRQALPENAPRGMIPAPDEAPAGDADAASPEGMIDKARRQWTRMEMLFREALRVPAIEKARALGEIPAAPLAVPASSKGLQHLFPLDEPDNGSIADPLEPINRHIHDFNKGLIDNVLDPISEYFIEHSSRGTQIGVSNFFANLREPITAGSSLLQGDFDDAGSSTLRFAINSTWGILGVYDRAAEIGYPKQIRTLDETLCTYGVPSGPYVVMPVFGSSSARDTSARLATMFAQYMVLGLYVIPYRVFDTTSQYLDVRERIQFLDAMALDDYSHYKAVYGQLTRLSCEQQPGLEKELLPR